MTTDLITETIKPPEPAVDLYELVEAFIAATGAQHTVEPKPGGRYEHKLIFDGEGYFLRRNP